MRDCIEEGILQSYVDDELSPEMAAKVAEHVASCPLCAESLSEAASETAIFSKAFEAEMALNVPTVRLRERLDAAIAELNRPVSVSETKQGWSFGGWLASFVEFFKVSPQRAVGFASLIAVVAFAAIFATIQLRQSKDGGNVQELVASKDGSTDPKPDSKANPSSSPAESNGNKPSGDDAKEPQSERKPKKQAKPIYVPEPDQLPKGDLAVKPLPGEEDYLKAIDSLMTEIAASDETSMKPSLRAEFERNLAVVDQAIDSTRRTARRNPNDSVAAEFLYSSYQSKLDLLTTVAEQTRPTIATR